MRVEFTRSIRVELPRPPRAEPFPSEQAYCPILCPFCGAARPRLLRSKEGARYYACRACNMNDETSFKVSVRPGDPALRRLSEEEPGRA